MKNWNNLEIKLRNPILISKALLKNNLNKFWENKMNHLDDNHHVLFILRLKFENNEVVTASTLQKINKTNKNDLIEYLYDRITSVSHETYKNKLPIVNSGNPSEYGKILSKNNDQYTIFVNNKTIIILNLLFKDNEQVNNIKYIKNGQTLFNWTDTIINKNCIVRDIGKSAYYYENMELILVKSIKNSKAIEKVKVSKKLDTKIITMDLETVLIDNIHVPYLLSWFDGNTTKSYIINPSDPVTIELEILKMINNAIDDICINKYKNYKVYFHNFSKFDGYFLVKYLAKIGDCDPIIHKGKIISLKFYYKDYEITFKDCYLLLPSSLKKLSKSFNVES